MSIYMKVPDISGNATESDYKNWIELDSIQINANKKVKMLVGDSGNRQQGRPTFEPVSISKRIDQSSPKLFHMMCKGNSASKVEICFADTRGERLKYTLSDVMINKRYVTAEGNSEPIENIELCYTAIEERYTPRDQNNNSLSPVSGGYNLMEAASL